MSGALVKISDVDVTSAVASVTLTGVSSDYDVYVLYAYDVQCATDNKNIIVHTTVGGTADTNAVYDSAFDQYRSDNTTSTSSSANNGSLTFAPSLSNATGETLSFIMYLHTFNENDRPSFVSVESNFVNVNSNNYGFQGGFMNSTNQACDGIRFIMESNANFSKGRFTLYGYNK